MYEVTAEKTVYIDDECLTVKELNRYRKIAGAPKNSAVDYQEENGYVTYRWSETVEYG